MIQLTAEQKKQHLEDQDSLESSSNKDQANQPLFQSNQSDQAFSQSLPRQSICRKDFKDGFAYKKQLKQLVKNQVFEWTQKKVYSNNRQNNSIQYITSTTNLYSQMGQLLEFMLKGQKSINISNWRVNLSQIVPIWSKRIQQIVNILKQREQRLGGIEQQLILQNINKQIKIIVNQLYKQVNDKKQLFLRSIMQCKQNQLKLTILTKLALLYQDQKQLSIYSDISFNPKTIKNKNKQKYRKYSITLKTVLSDSYMLSMRYRLEEIKTVIIRKNLITNFQSLYPNLQLNKVNVHLNQMVKQINTSEISPIKKDKAPLIEQPKKIDVADKEEINKQNIPNFDKTGKRGRIFYESPDGPL